MADLRTHLVLGRASNLSTVWSNVLCAWIIVGGYSNLQLASFLAGATLVYIGGMYLNDFCDVDFDREHRPERPIPAGLISPGGVRNFAIAFLASGSALLMVNGWLPAAFSLLLLACIVVYDITHKRSPIAPIYMAACRACLYFIVASAFENGIDFNVCATAGAIFVFVLGVTFLARSESTDNAIDYPAVAMIVLPVLAAFYVRREDFDAQRGAVIALLVGWSALALFRSRVSGKLIIGRMIGPLLAAIPLVDLLALSALGLATQTHLIIFAGLFALATAAQRLIPAS